MVLGHVSEVNQFKPNSHLGRYVWGYEEDRKGVLFINSALIFPECSHRYWQLYDLQLF